MRFRVHFISNLYVIALAHICNFDSKMFYNPTIGSLLISWWMFCIVGTLHTAKISVSYICIWTDRLHTMRHDHCVILQCSFASYRKFGTIKHAAKGLDNVGRYIYIVYMKYRMMFCLWLNPKMFSNSGFQFW